MATAPKLLTLAGSLREGSFNKTVVRCAGEAARAAGADVTDLDLADFHMPLFNEDDERANGLPAGAVRFRELLKSHHGFLLASPEYNGSMSAALKNAIDWATRPAEGEGRLACFDGKWAGLLGASQGGLGGIRGLFHLRDVLFGIGTVVLSNQFAVGAVHEELDGAGAMKPGPKRDGVEAVGRELAQRVAASINAG